MDKFSKRLKIAMTEQKITQAELCKKTNIPKSAMSQYIKGSFCPKADRTYVIAQALNVSEAWLMGYDVSINYDIDKEFIELFKQLTNNEKQYIIKSAAELIAMRNQNEND